MDFASYALQGVRLVNADLPDLAALREQVTYLRGKRPDRDPAQVTQRDLVTLRALQPMIRNVFEHAAAGDEQAAVSRLNQLLMRFPITPIISGHDHQSWHLHVTTAGADFADELATAAVLGLAMTVIDQGADRLGVCAGDWCPNVYLDTSPNRSRRYCSDRCASRANVAAFRARKKAAAAKRRSRRLGNR